MILKRLKLLLLSVLGAPLMLLSPLVRKSVRKLEHQYENNPESLPVEIRQSMHFTRLGDKAYEELKNGNCGLAESLAKELLNLSRKFKDHWNYGNAIHHSNTILGLIAIKQNNINEAAEYLKKSGETPGSPQLDSHGPSFCLAVELLNNNRNDDVLNYLNQVGEFWEYGFKYLAAWRTEIESNNIPDSWQRFEY